MCRHTCQLEIGIAAAAEPARAFDGDPPHQAIPPAGSENVARHLAWYVGVSPLGRRQRTNWLRCASMHARRRGRSPSPPRARGR